MCYSDSFLYLLHICNLIRCQTRLLSFGREQQDRVRKLISTFYLSQSFLICACEMTDPYIEYNAAKTGDLEKIILLVEQGADKDKLYRGGNNSIIPLRYGYGKLVSGGTLLYIASSNGHLPVVRYLVEQGADMEKGSGDWTPLIVASYRGHLDVARYLLEHGANGDKANDEGRTSLFYAIQESNLDVALYLLEQGIDKDKADIDGFSPLHIAADKGHLEIVR